MCKEFAGRVAVVTGGSRGIGLAIGKRLAAGGAAVAVVSTTLEHSTAASEQILAAGAPRALPYACDVSDGTAVKAVCDRILADFDNRVDILVNNAGITRDNLLMRMEEEAWDRVLDVNLKGAFLFCKNLIRPMMKARFGRIVNVASMVGLTGNAGQANYVAAKAGLIGLGKSLAREVASRNITVNMVAPGFIETDMTAGLSEVSRKAYLDSVPLGRTGVPEDIAGAVAFLAGPEAGYITGQVLSVDGGFTMR